MAPPLHLDAARSGLAPYRVRAALGSLAEFFGREGLSAGLDTLLKDGFASWPEERRTRYPGLSDWGGVDELGKAAGQRVIRGTANLYGLWVLWTGT